MPSLDSLAQEIRLWHEELRLAGVYETLEGAAQHLTDEAIELQKEPRDGEEMADVFHLLVSVAFKAGVDLPTAIEAKLAKNKLRQWHPPDVNGVVHHSCSPSSASDDHHYWSKAKDKDNG